MVKENLAKELGEDKRYTTVTVDTYITGRDLTTRDVARWVESDKGYGEFLAQVKGQAGVGKVVIVPQILGTKGDYTVYNRLVKDLGCSVVETTGMPPSVNGIRLRDVLLSALKKKGIRVIENAKAEKAIVKGDVVTAIDRKSVV